MQLTIDTERATALADTFDVQALAAEELVLIIDRAAEAAELPTDSGRRLATVAQRWPVAAAVIRLAADGVEGAELDLEAAAAALGVSVAELQAQVEGLAGYAEGDRDQLLAALLLDFIPPPTTVRDLVPGLPPIGADPDLDDAIARLDPILIPLIRAGEDINSDSLDAKQQADLRLLASALGGDTFTVSVREREKYSGAGGDDEYRTVTREVPVTELESGVVALFVGQQLQRAATIRPIRVKLVRGAERFVSEFEALEAGGADRAEIAATLDIPEADLDRALVFSSALVGLNDGAGFPDNLDPSGVDVTALSFGPDDLPDLTDDEYRAVIDELVVPLLAGVTDLDDVEDRLDNLAVLEFGARVVEFSANLVADVAGALSAVLPDRFGGDFLEAVSGLAEGIADQAGIFAKGFGDLIERVRNILNGTTVEERRRDFDNSQDRRDNLRDEGHDPSIRDDDFSGDQETGGNGLL